MTVLIILQIQYSASMFLSNNFNAKKNFKKRENLKMQKKVLSQL